ncbi:MAG TPA: alpha/beta hydrolase [Gemmatimonas sp.]|nr:alpha/beta hydrolase [Gemmatimonas sp.]
MHITTTERISMSQQNARPRIATGAATRFTLAGMGLAGAVLLGGCGDTAVKEGGSADTSGVASGRADSTIGATSAGASTTADSQMQAVLDQLGSMGGKPIETLTPEEARKQPTPAAAATLVAAAAGKDTTPTAMVPGVTSVDRTIPGAAGGMPARVYTPDGAGPFPVVVYYHGGGWVIADKNVYDGGARGIAKAANAVVVSVDYRLAPEHKFPAQHDDALAAYRWALKNAASIKGDPNNIALAGESAGGNLALATAIAARDAKLALPKAVISVYPIAQPDTTTASYVANANAKPLNRAMMGWFAKQTVRTPADLQDPRINLVKANLAGLPAVTIINATIDPLLDDGAMLEQSLKSAGVSVERRVYGGVAHEFFGMGAVIDKAKDAQQYAGDRLKAAFGK